VASSVFYLLFCFELARRGLFARYYAQFTLIATLAIHSTYYHVCWTHEYNWCIGSWGTSAMDIALTRDTMAVVQSFNAITVIVDQLMWKHMKEGEMYLAVYYVMMSLISTFMVVHLGQSDTLVATLIIPFVHLGVLFATLFMVVRRQSNSFFWYVRALLAAAFMIVGVVLKFLATEKEFSSGSSIQSDHYNLFESFAHIFTGLAMVLFLTLISTSLPAGTAPFVYGKVATSTTDKVQSKAAATAGRVVLAPSRY